MGGRSILMGNNQSKSSEKDYPEERIQRQLLKALRMDGKTDNTAETKLGLIAKKVVSKTTRID